MINTNRIVPVTKTDLISLYGLILLQASGNSSLAKLDAANGSGAFSCSTNSALVLCSEPVRTLDFTAAVSAATVYFLAAYDYEGFTASGSAVTTTGTVAPMDGTLYKAVLSSGSVTITKAGF